MALNQHQHTEMTDRELIVDAKHGCQAALDALIDRHYPHVLHFLLKLEHDPDEARDLLQETFEDALRSVDRIPEDRPFRAWLFQTARNNYRHSRRQRRVHAALSLDWAFASIKKSAPELQQDDSSAGYSDQDMVQRLLTEISPKLREPLIFISLGYSTREIGELLDISHAAARKRVSRAMQQFRDRYQERQEGTDWTA